MITTNERGWVIGVIIASVVFLDSNKRYRSCLIVSNMTTILAGLLIGVSAHSFVARAPDADQIDALPVIAFLTMLERVLNQLTGEGIMYNISEELAVACYTLATWIIVTPDPTDTVDAMCLSVLLLLSILVNLKNTTVRKTLVMVVCLVFHVGVEILGAQSNVEPHPQNVPMSRTRIEERFKQHVKRGEKCHTPLPTQAVYTRGLRRS